MTEYRGLILVCVGDESKVTCLYNLKGRAEQLIIVTTRESIERAVKDLGFPHTILCTNDSIALLEIHEFVHKALVLGDMLPTISFFVELIHFNLHVPITVVTRNKQYPTGLYKTIGAKYVIYTNCNNVVPFVS